MGGGTAEFPRLGPQLVESYGLQIVDRWSIFGLMTQLEGRVENVSHNKPSNVRSQKESCKPQVEM